VKVSVEPLLIGELMKNLIGNALLYAGTGSEVTVRINSTASAAILEVEDNGPGIPVEKREQVLKRFERGGHSDRAGAGLGLPIVEEIARLHGASMSLMDGEGGRGLKVLIEFPVAG
jgi:two-component system sensor histidine kinase TctE